MYYLFLFLCINLLAWFTSCKSHNESPQVHSFPGPPSVALQDKDRDGLSDPLEIKLGTITGISNFPSFEVDQHISSQLSLYEKSSQNQVLRWDSEQSLSPSKLLRLTRSKMSKLSYIKDIKLSSEENIDLPIIPLPTIIATNLLEYDWFLFKSKLQEIKSVKNMFSLQLQSQVNISLQDFEGIREIKNISTKLGYYKDDQFIELTHSFILKDELGNPLSLGEKLSHAQAFLSFELTNTKQIEELISLKSQIYLKFLDYNASTFENHEYTFSKQWSYARSNSDPLFISTPNRDRIILIDRNLNYKDALKIIHPNFKEDKDKRIESIAQYTSQYLISAPITQYNNEQLSRRKWHTIRQNENTYIGFYSILEMAHAYKKLISKEKLTFNQLSKVHHFKNLRIGEKITLKVYGNYKVPQLKISSPRKREVTYKRVQYSPGESTTCRPTLLRDCRGDRNLEPGPPIRRVVQEKINCYQTLNEIEWVQHNFEEPDKLIITNESNLKISNLDISTLTGAKALFNHERKQVELTFRINEEFINEYGNQLRFYIRDDIANHSFKLGTAHVKCDKQLPKSFDHIKEFGQVIYKSYEQKNNINMEYLRSF